MGSTSTSRSGGCRGPEEQSDSQVEVGGDIGFVSYDHRLGSSCPRGVGTGSGQRRVHSLASMAGSGSC